MRCQRNATVLAPLADALSGLGRPPSAAVLAAFARYLDLLLDANSRMNLTAVRDADAVVRRHFVESAVFGGALEAQGLLRDGVRVVDVGSGAGFPGLPLKLLWPHLRLTLVEATGKKAAFLSEVVQALALPGVEVCAMRAETAGRDPALRERFDLAVSRAVAPLAVLAELTLPLLRVGGSSAGIKGSRLAEEMRAAAVAIERLGGGAPRELPLPHGVAPPEPAPRFFVLTKSRPTPVDLPRRAGVTSSNPLR